ncbi:MULTISPECIES: putative bifunctional diguanylate cyclase/phosphodiesterase [Alphaproteobacteria]|uniref:Bifunctional diguanylate cyclase/phosphodiesterase n=2 Tax=Alphaproteobacteria TaxID=28211 RepID=A0A512HEN9_9HYPH|nr:MULTISPECIES: bifunctional diguanylate cyclase/phosphodiesterase [Alphaproteobacteria]GEO83926.1 bifunctional diguanylate cyclase/phosphodiesterase [Ciceribacter naphthalenivorans]GLR21196.1 bifunctional diguanylate cyclase/phosphodiesterase [Ciceribacter naphthalenivorans]GLT04052.1 bifunctional diguanylate cyclase/phosphodiesterase [Sphingomonas psychrolutea]
MLNILTCIAIDHDPVFLGFSVAICVFGSLLTMRLFGRVRSNRGVARISWLALTSVIGGCSIWTTHFVAMMGYETGLAVGYEPLVTLLSLACAVLVTGLGFAVAGLPARSPLIEAGGVIVGLGIALMHYLGMSAYQVQGHLVWDSTYVVLSLVLAAFFGALATNRVARPVTHLCRYGGALSLILAIASTHFTGMTAVSVIADSTAALPANSLNEGILTVVVVAITVMILILGAMTYVIDIQATQASLARYRHLSLHDALTGLSNRMGFLEHTSRLLAGPNGNAVRLAILSFDLDRFKEINDVHGHAMGDDVLRVVSERLSAKLRDGEFLARIGGDEFVAVSSRYFNRGDATQLAQRLIREISRPIVRNGVTVNVGSSFGISVYPDNGETLDDLLAQADVAMYRAKASGTNEICFYDISMDRQARERNALAMEMREGLERGEFELVYQQQNNAKSGEVIGFEALLRWNHPSRGRVPPCDFIPIAEKNGFIMKLGEWVLREACREASTWRRPLRLAVNVAPQQLAKGNLPRLVEEVLADSGLAPQRLELEITESGIIADQQNALQIIRQLKALGVKVAMDDYGTGYSSLSTLQLFPFDKIKIDRAFIDQVATNRQSAAIVHSTLILAASLDIPVLAEGVESAEQIEFLIGAGCERVQGFYYGKPLSRAQLDACIGLPLPPAFEARPGEDGSCGPAKKEAA